MTAKLHINLNQGLVEVEGSEEFVLKVYNDFKDKIARAPYSPQNTGQQNQPLAGPTAQPITNAVLKKDSAGKSGGTKKKSAGKSYGFSKDLNLYAEGDKPSLEDFMDGYNASSNQPRFLLFVHYLKVVKGLEKVGVNEIYTCLKKLNLKIPNIEQVLRNTSSRTGWLDTSSSDDITITIGGENAIGHELVKKQEAAA